VFGKQAANRLLACSTLGRGAQYARAMMLVACKPDQGFPIE
jgi:hypothetical protein